MKNLRYLTILFVVLLFPCVASTGVKIGNIQFDERGKIVFANTTSGKIIFPDKTEQGTATLKGDRGDKGDLGDKGDRGDKGDKGDPGQVDKAAICKVYADERITLPAFCAKKIVFLSSQKFTANLGGLAGADAKCQGMADAAGLTGVFKAWLSDSKTSAKDRLVHHTGSYVRTDGAVVAINWFDLTDGWLKEPIMCDEYKVCDNELYDYSANATLMEGAVMTGTWKTGLRVSDDDESFCYDWTDGEFNSSAASGQIGQIDDNWTGNRSTFINAYCFSPYNRIYCIEQ